MDNINVVDGKEALSQAFLDYSAYNLQRRAIPDVRDCMKWSARQLIHAQSLAKLTYDKPFKKALKSVGQVTSFSYTHGDASCYGTFIRMAKPFAYRYPLQEANGNFGTLIDPQDHSASRYVEIRGSKLASLLLKDLDKDTIEESEWEDTYDLEGKFPKVLPSKGFYNIVNGCQSIGSGLVSSIPQFNLREVNEALIKLIKNPNIDFEEILCYPDFATGGTIVNQEEVKESLRLGHGKACKIRATIEYDAKENALIVKEMPYSVYTNTICKELANIITENTQTGIKDYLDMTGTSPNFYIYLTKNANPVSVIKFLYKNTSLQSHFGINMNMLENGEIPKTFGWKEALQCHINHEREVYKKGFKFDLNKILNRIHILDGLLIALANINDVVKVIKESLSTSEANKNLREKFLLTEAQAKAVLDIKLSRLAHLEVEKLQKEKNDLEVERKKIEDILNNSELLDGVLIDAWKEVANKYGDARRTKITNLESDDNSEPIEKKQLVAYLTNCNNLYAYEDSILISRKRNSVGTKIKFDSGEFIKQTIVDSNYNNFLAFSNKGKVYKICINDIELDMKISLSGLLKLEEGEVITTIMSDKNHDNKYILFVTKNGTVKKTDFKEYSFKKSIGVSALKLKDGDELIKVLLVNDKDYLGIASQNGYFTIFNVDTVPLVKRVAAGVKGITLKDNSCVCDAVLINDGDTELISVTKQGFVKRTLLSEFSITNRGGKGIVAHKLENDELVAIGVVKDENGEVIVSSNNSTNKFGIKEAPLLQRNTIGNKCLKIKEGQEITGMVVM